MDSLVKQKRQKLNFGFDSDKFRKIGSTKTTTIQKNKKKGKWSATSKKRGALYRPTPMEKWQLENNCDLAGRRLKSLLRPLRRTPVPLQAYDGDVKQLVKFSIFNLQFQLEKNIIYLYCPLYGRFIKFAKNKRSYGLSLHYDFHSNFFMKLSFYCFYVGFIFKTSLRKMKAASITLKENKDEEWPFY